MTNGFGGGKANNVHLKVAQNSVLETINEPMHGQFTTVHPGIAQKRGTAKIPDLEDHIDFAELFCALDRIVYGFDLFAISLESFGDRRKPVIDESDCASNRRLYAAATVVAANNDVDDFENIYCVLDGGEAVEIGQGDDVCDVAVDKDLARLQADDFAGGNPAVRASDPQKLRDLLLGKPLEEPRLPLPHLPRPIPVIFEQRLKIYSKIAGHRRATVGAPPGAGKDAVIFPAIPREEKEPSKRDVRFAESCGDTV